MKLTFPISFRHLSMPMPCKHQNSGSSMLEFGIQGFVQGFWDHLRAS
jgi:hypothetical protein